MPLEKTIFISDTHFGFKSFEEEKARRLLFERLIKYTSYHASGIWLLGDIFDFWFEYRKAVPSEYLSTLHSFMDLRDSGVTVNFVAGNHDYWTLSALETGAGINIHKKPQDVILGGRKFLLSHGDDFSGRDTGYTLLKNLLRAPWFTRVYRLIHPDLGLPMGHMLSLVSRMNKRDRLQITSRYYNSVAKSGFSMGYGGLISGHTHYPCIKVDDGKVYLNTGDWVLQRTFAELEGTVLKLMTWDENAGPVVTASTDLLEPADSDTCPAGEKL